MNGTLATNDDAQPETISEQIAADTQSLNLDELPYLLEKRVFVPVEETGDHIYTLAAPPLSAEHKEAHREFTRRRDIEVGYDVRPIVLDKLELADDQLEAIRGANRSA